MPKLDTRALLEERAQSLQRYLGKRGAYSEGKIDFPSARYPCSVSYVSRRSLMSTNYFLSLKAIVPCPDADSDTKSTCYLNRLGSWKLKGSDPVLRDIWTSLRTSSPLEQLTRKTDLDSIILTAEHGEISVQANLYGGGFAAIMLPPIRFKVGISKEQLALGTKLLAALVEQVEPCCNVMSA